MALTPWQTKTGKSVDDNRTNNFKEATLTPWQAETKRSIGSKRTPQQMALTPWQAETDQERGQQTANEINKGWYSQAGK